MTLLDIALIIGMTAIVAMEAKRGFGRAILDMLALYGSLWVAAIVYDPLAQAVHPTAEAAVNQAFAYAVCFLSVGALGLAMASVAYEIMQISAGMLDRSLGVAVGLVVAVILAHATVRSIDLGTQVPRHGSAVASSPVAEEALTFDGFHHIIDNLSQSAGGTTKPAVL